MKMAVFGTGMVGQAIATKLVALGHDVRMGSRSATNEKSAAFVKAAGAKASAGTFADAAAFGEMAWLCTAGSGAVDAVQAAGAANLRGKILVDITNPLDFSKGMPPSLFVPSTDSLAERVQAVLPDAKVVKTLNTINCNLMVDAGRLAGGEHDVFVAGNDAAAKGSVTEILKGGFGWKHVVDLGDLTAARALEAYVLLWVRMYGALQSPDFNIKIVR